MTNEWQAIDFEELMRKLTAANVRKIRDAARNYIADKYLKHMITTHEVAMPIVDYVVERYMVESGGRNLATFYALNDNKLPTNACAMMDCPFAFMRCGPSTTCAQVPYLVSSDIL